MADKGAMIELQINPNRITHLAPLHQSTTLVGGDRDGFIVAPGTGEFAAIAGQLQRRLEALTGRELALVDEAESWNPEGLAAPVIAVGHAGNNMLLRSLHYLGFLNHADYPTEGLRVRSIHNPYGDGNNVLCVLGYTPEACGASAERLLQAIEQAEGTWQVPGPLHLREPAMKTDDPAEWLPKLQGLDSSSSGGPLLMHPLKIAAESGEERWARAFIEALIPYATGRVPLTFAKMCHVDFWTDRLVMDWDALEELPYFTDEERLMATNFLASCAQYCNDSITYQKWRILKEEHQIFNHHTFPATGLFFSCMYLRRHGYELPELDGWLTKSLKVFGRAATAGRSYDEGGAGYSWLVGNHLLRVSLALGDTSYAASEKMTRYADLAAVIQNNAFELVPFGDCGGYHATRTGAGNILLRAAEFHRDPGYKWLAQRHDPLAAEEDVFTRELPSAPPDKHLGLFVLPMDPVIHRWAGLPHFPGYPTPPSVPTVPPEQGFDKLSLRGGWEPTDDYLLVQGFGAGQHGHPDANAISQYQAQGRLFLVDSDYILRMPAQHNMVMVIRDGQHGRIPVTARLDSVFEFNEGAFTQTTLPGYNGCDWQRAILWLRNDCALVVDTLTALEAGDYELRCYWRTLAETTLTERGLHTVHDGEHFRVVEATESARRLDTEPPPVNQLTYPRYDFGEAIPQVLRETQRARLEAGQQACFVNLLLPNRQTEAPRRAVRLADGRVSLTGEGRTVFIGADGFEIEDSSSYAFAERERLTGLVATGEKRSRPAAKALGTATAPVEVSWEVSLPTAATALAGGPADSILVGCDDGLIGCVSANGKLAELARAEGKIGAVLSANLWGEQQPTIMAASYDCTLRLLQADGTERMSIAFPHGSHLPAHGRALTVANLDGDGRLWPILGTAAWRVQAITPEGGVRWTFDTAAHAVTAVTAGDLNHDGRDEIAVGTVYFCVPAITADGARLWEDEDYNDFWSAGPIFPFVHVADVDGDGELEVITAGSDTLIHCIDHLGIKKWTCSVGDEARGLLVTPAGIVAASATGDVLLVDGRGNVVWRHMDEMPCTAAALSGEAICVAREDGRLEWLTQGKLLARHQLPAPATRLQATAQGVVAALDDGRLMGLRL
jgi:hypothetical protein